LFKESVNCPKVKRNQTFKRKIKIYKAIREVSKIKPLEIKRIFKLAS